MSVIAMKDLLEAGVHFGHRTHRWNPKMRRYIFTERSGIHIIDLQQTLQQTEAAYERIRDTVAKGGSVLFVGTKRQAEVVVARERHDGFATEATGLAFGVENGGVAPLALVSDARQLGFDPLCPRGHVGSSVASTTAAIAVVIWAT